MIVIIFLDLNAKSCTIRLFEFDAVAGMSEFRRRSFDQRVADELAADGMDRVLARLFAARGVRSHLDLQSSLSQLPDWRAMKGMDKAATILSRAIQQGRRIVVLSDYDADGATGCAVAVRGLRSLGGVVDFVIPLRHVHGYGLTPDIVPQVLAAKPDLVVTVDNGISSLQGVAMLREQGVPVVVTDHHIAPETLPAANAIVNPNQPGCDFPSKAVSGVGVMFYTLCATRARLSDEGWFSGDRSAPNLAELLPIVALGTVADVVPLDHTNRIIVTQGLQRARAGRLPSGVAALAQAASRPLSRLCAQDFGFYLGPRLNAVGRLDDMRVGVECLISDDEAQAQAIAKRLEEFNRQRKSIQNDVQDEALDQVGEPSGFSIAVSGDWNAGVVGIVAGRLKDRFRRPTFVFSMPNEEGVIKGSGRSIPGYHLRDALARMEVAYPGLFKGFGGHAMAAGASVPAERFEQFREAFEQDASACLTPEHFLDVVETDGELPPEHVCLDFAEELERHVWGQGFPEPVFDGTFVIRDTRNIGETHLKLRLSDGVGTHNAIWFGARQYGPPDLRERMRFAYKLQVNEYQGNRSVQLMVVGVEGA